MGATEEFEIKKEAMYAVCNALLGGSAAVVSLLVELRVLPALLELLECPEARLVMTALESIEAILVAGASAGGAGGLNPAARLVEEAGGLDAATGAGAAAFAQARDTKGGVLDGVQPDSRLFRADRRRVCRRVDAEASGDGRDGGV